MPVAPTQGNTGPGRDLLHGLKPLSRIPGRNLSKADLLVYRDEAGRIAVKSYQDRPWWVRQTIGRWSIRRESLAYLGAGPLPGLPRFLGRLGPWALATRWVDATPLAEIDAAALDIAWFDRLDELLQRLHERGVALADLHHRDVLIAADGGVWVVDLAMATVLGARAGRLRRALFRRMMDADRVAAARMRARAEGRDPEAAVARLGGQAARWHRRGRRIKRLLALLRGRPR